MQQMEAAAYSVSIAESAAAALALLDADVGVDLIVSDVSIPGMDGVQLIQQAQRRLPQLPAIFLTGLAHNGAESALGHVITGPFAVVHKSFDAEQLANRVAKLLRGRAKPGRPLDRRMSGQSSLQHPDDHEHSAVLVIRRRAPAWVRRSASR
jgi:DNA-binding NtrC family response regulator